MTPEPGPEVGRNRPHQYLVLAALVGGLLVLALRSGALGSGQVMFFAVLLPSIILHEVSHGAVALAFGDPTAREAGRLTLNPVRHIDPFWTIILPAMMIFSTGRAFGMAKPVPVDPSRMRSPRNHGLLVSLAGPATNVVVAVLALVAFRITGPAGTTGRLLVTLGVANVVLATFNMLPIPPLDGSALVERLLPSRWLPAYGSLRRYSFVLFIGLFLVSGELLGRAIDPVVDLWFRLLVS